MVFGGEDVGIAGAWQEMKVGAGTLNELRNLAGPAPIPGMKMFQVNLQTGECSWRYASKARNYGRTGRSNRRKK